MNGYTKLIKIILLGDNAVGKTSITHRLMNKGFDVNQNSYANYPGTTHSVTSTLNMMYLNFLTEETIGQHQEFRIPEKMVEETLSAYELILKETF